MFGKTEALLAQAMLSLPGHQGLRDRFGVRRHAPARQPPTTTPSCRRATASGTLTNRSGGVQGGITNGEPIVFRVAFKPPATIGQAAADRRLSTASRSTLEAKGRHDPCVVPRAVPIVESMAALVLADLALIQAMRQPVA